MNAEPSVFCVALTELTVSVSGVFISNARGKHEDTTASLCDSACWSTGASQVQLTNFGSTPGTITLLSLVLAAAAVRLLKTMKLLQEHLVENFIFILLPG